MWCAAGVHLIGPLLFTIYIKDLPDILTAYKTNLYANDTGITFVGNNSLEIKKGLETVLQVVKPWFNYNRLSLNCDKTQFMIFCTHHSCTSICLEHIEHGGNKISRATKVDFLGMQLDPLLT